MTNPPHPDAPQPVLLVLADISGYTRYMTANAKTLAHSQTIITELVEAIIRQIELPLEVAKLEGDAVFLFCRKQDGAQPWPEVRRIIGEKLLTFFRRFGEKIGELSQSTTCTCNACVHIEKLRLKVVVHSGEALFHRVLNFVELAGVDVIIVHRLLKNSVNADQYLLLTEAARHDLEFPADISFARSTETYDGLGKISTHVFFPGNAAGDATPVGERVSYGTRLRRSWKLFCQLWFAPFTTRRKNFRNVMTEAGTAAKFSYALIVILLTPFFLPVGALLSLIHAFKAEKTSHKEVCHEHKTAGSCCH